MRRGDRGDWTTIPLDLGKGCLLRQRQKRSTSRRALLLAIVVFYKPFTEMLWVDSLT